MIFKPSRASKWAAPLAEATHPLGDHVDLIDGDERVHQDAVLQPGDQCAAHRRPHRFVAWRLGGNAGERAHRGDVDIDG